MTNGHPVIAIQRDGQQWFATTRRHIGYESWVERDQLMALDANPETVGVASQPFRLRWPDGRHHVPDYYARRSDGTVVIVDVRPDDRIPESDAELFARSEVVCIAAGWQYRRVGVLDPVLAANLRWLSGYRHPRALRPGVAAELLSCFAREQPLLEGATAVGDPLVVLPVLFHLLWHRRLVVDLSRTVLDDRTAVSAAAL
ncbi:TnsA-like heteromeric transposase endonuclease subunit [Mycolicibacterium mucogenicum]|uniref:TnsA-like heteromeric transposase endonuclease subunit n=1 Tax=Mycolicibacterium mucogenicum TaxID=56689 RepID=UPI0009EDE40A|nr:TnsA-like heteromeric transposase endonuclease subunit [Mycolicibacterium mucogenicum]